MIKTATKKAVDVQYISFEDFVKYGAEKAPSDAVHHGGFAWSFEFEGNPVTHENDSCYLVPTKHGIVTFVNDGSMLMIQPDGEIYPCDKDTFERTYTVKAVGLKSGIKLVKLEELARKMYDNYRVSVGGKAWNGDVLPKSDEFFDDATKSKQAYGLLLEVPTTAGKSLGNTTDSKASENVKDVVFWGGGGDMWKLLGKASSKNEGWMKSSKAMEIPGVGCCVQVTTQQGDNVAEAVTFVPNTKIVETIDEETGKVVARELNII